MKFAVIALVAVVAAETSLIATDKTDASDWATCKTGADCKGISFYCCTVTKSSDGSDASPGNKLCADKAQNGRVPSTVTSGLGGFQYLCSKADFSDPTNTDSKDASNLAATGSTSLAVSASAAAVTAFLLA